MNYFQNVLATSDNGSLIAATSNNYDNQGEKLDLYLLKVVSSGNYISTEITNKKANKSVLIYPNPGSSNIKINCTNCENNVEFVLHSLSGAILIREHINTEESTFSSTNLTSGMYIYTLHKNGEIIDRGKWIKE